MNKEMIAIIKDLADLGEAIEDLGNECFLCDYQPAFGRRIQSNVGYRPPYAPHKEYKIEDDPYPHYGSEDCLIYRAMKLKEKL